MLQPKRVKYRRPHGLSYEGKSKAGMKYHLVNSVYKLLKANTLQLDKLKLLVSFYQDIQIDKDKFGLEFILHIVKQRNLLKFVWVLVKVPQINGLQS